MKTIIADTNAFLRFLLNDIPEQKDAFEKMLQQAKKTQLTIIVPQIIIFEIHFVLEKYYQFPKEKIFTTLQTIISVDYLQIESRETFLAALTLYEPMTISLVDCFLIAKAQEDDAELFTFDKKIKRLL